MRGSARRWFALALTLVLLAGACSGDDDDGGDRPSVDGGATETDADAEVGGRLVVGLASTPDTFDPAASSLTVAGLTAALAVFDPLMAVDAAGAVVPYLAESLEADGEHRVWTLVLRDGVTFSNGEPLTSEAVVQVFERHLASELTRQALRDVESVGAVDRRTIAFRLKQSWATFPSVLTGRLGLVPAPSMQTDPIGTGPFLVESWVPGSSVRLVRSPTYWRAEEGLPHLDELELRAVPDPAERVALLTAGGIDVLVAAEPAGIAAVAGLDEDDIATAVVDDGALATYAVVFNTAAAPFDDPACRAAVAAAVDRDELADAVAPDALIVPERTDVDDEGDVGRCAFTYRTGPSELDDAVGDQLREMLGDAGIEMEVASSEPSSVRLDALLGDYEAFGLLDEDLLDPDERRALLDGANAAPPGTLARNVSRIEDAALQEALEAARGAVEPGRRDDLEARVDELVAERLPHLVLFRSPWVFAFEATVGGVRRGLTLPGGGDALPRAGVLLAAELHTTAAPE